MKRLKSLTGGVAASVLLVAATLGAFSIPVLAQQSAPIQLESNDGSILITGRLVEFSNGQYVLNTDDFGILRIKAESVTCTGVVCPDQAADFGPEFGIHGSRTVGTTLVPNLLRGYAAHVGADFEIVETSDETSRIIRLTNPDGSLRAEIDLTTPGSGAAVPALLENVAEIGLTDRRFNQSDLEKMQAAGLSDLRDTADETVLAVDGIAVIVNENNPVRNLSATDIARIWAGEITNWRELGGGNVPISVQTYAVGNGDREVMLNGLVRPNGRDETAEVTRHGPYQDLVDAVMADRGGIGFVGRWLARTNDVRLLDIREECGLLSPPSDFRMKIEGYALSRRLYAYTMPGRVMHPEARAFLDWTLTPPAQQYVKESAFVDRELERMRLEDMGMMLVHTAAVEPDFSGAQYSEMMRELRGADRLSISFRFNTGSAILDQESIRNVQELATRMDSGEFEGLEVLLVGFADSVGERGRNTALAKARADSVARILREALAGETASRLPVVPLSFGELLPLSCNDTEVGRERNRRVEVWLRVPESRSNLR